MSPLTIALSVTMMVVQRIHITDLLDVINNSTVFGNLAGGIYKSHGTLMINNSTVTGNSNRLSFGSGGISSWSGWWLFRCSLFAK